MDAPVAEESARGRTTPRAKSGDTTTPLLRRHAAIVRLCAAVVLCCQWQGLLAADAPPAKVEKNAGGFAVTGLTYSAAANTKGDLFSIRIDGVEICANTPPARGWGFPGKEPAERVELSGHTLTAMRGAIRVQYAFEQSGIAVETEGEAIEPEVQGLTLLICRNGVTKKVAPYTGEVSKFIAGKAVFALSDPFHHMAAGKLVPSRICSGTKREAKFAYRIECGAAVTPIEMIAGLEIAAEGFFARPYKSASFAKGEAARFTLLSGNLGAVGLAGEARVVLKDHYGPAGKTLKEERVGMPLPAGQNVSIPYAPGGITEAGFYWLHAELCVDGQAVRKAMLPFIYDGGSYKPPLTRPADFKEFWDAKLKEMRALPFDAKLTEAPTKSNERFVHYGLEITVAGGKRIQTFLRLPRAAGKHDAEVHSHWGSDTDDKIMEQLAKLEKQEQGAGMWQRGADRVRVGAPQPQDSTYTRWAGRDDNNMLDSYLLNVRMSDYLRSRDDVAGIWIFGASRSGASQLVCAALAPERVVAVNVHVPTSCGLSWTGKPYAGWGSRPAGDEGARVAAYFDPVNFAPDLTVPLLLDGGDNDGLAPSNGILAFCNWAEKSPWKRCAIEKGGHGYFSKPARDQFEKELAEYLKLPQR